MRTWRVGTISMGASLILLGVLLFLGQWLDIYSLFLSWWPLLCVVLGVEILVYLALAKRETAYIKYDLFSIFFVGVLGTVALSFMLLNVSGILPEVQRILATEERTFDLPVVKEQIPEHIERIVIDANYQYIIVEGTDENELSMFGTYRAQIVKEDPEPLVKRSDYVALHESGDTLYITVKQPPRSSGIIDTYVSMSSFLIVPREIEIDIRNGEHSVEVEEELVS
ncbi:hypothetical protein, partial [Alkalihalobacterium bogoriense]|uniref:hypothetical protein n=1 Tax=Alkalihalobacterium bogoriense TaxID=246272 RepID=UPI0005553029